MLSASAWTSRFWPRYTPVRCVSSSKLSTENSVISLRFGTLLAKALVTLNGLPNIVTAFSSTITASTSTRSTASHTYKPCTYCTSILTVCTSTFRSGIESGYGLAKSCGSFQIRSGSAFRNTTFPPGADLLYLYTFSLPYTAYLYRARIEKRFSI